MHDYPHILLLHDSILNHWHWFNRTSQTEHQGAIPMLFAINRIKTATK